MQIDIYLFKQREKGSLRSRVTHGHEQIHKANFCFSYIFLNAYISTVLDTIELKFSKDDGSLRMSFLIW